MAYKITDNCVACGTCQGECPTGAIHVVNFTPKKIEPKPEIKKEATNE